jgi:peptide subunit release factor 1 (eRF1)
MTGDSATLYLVSKNEIINLWQDSIRRRNATRRGGQSAARIQRIRKMDIHIWEQHVQSELQKYSKQFQGLLILGNGPLMKHIHNPKLLELIPYDQFENNATLKESTLLHFYKEFYSQLEKRAFGKLLIRVKTWIKVQPERLIYGIADLTKAIDAANIKTLIVHPEIQIPKQLLLDCRSKGSSIYQVNDPWLIDFGGFIGIRFFQNTK